MKFYIRLGILFGKYVNRCLVFNNLQKPYWCNATEIIGNLTFKEIKL
jgi:hypothetical protein